MISRNSSSAPKENDVSPGLHYCDLRPSQTRRRHLHTCRWWSKARCRCCPVLPWLSSTLPGISPVLSGAPKVLSGALRCSQTIHTHLHCSPVPVIRDPSYSEGQQESSPGVWYSPEIGASKFTLHILSDTAGGFQWLKYILLMSVCQLPSGPSLKIDPQTWEAVCLGFCSTLLFQIYDIDYAPNNT